MSEMRCETCSFWEDDREPDDSCELCLCRRHAPVPIAIEAEKGYPWNCEPQYGLALWPATHCMDYCGEWKGKD